MEASTVEGQAEKPAEVASREGRPAEGHRNSSGQPLPVLAQPLRLLIRRADTFLLFLHLLQSNCQCSEETKG